MAKLTVSNAHVSYANRSHNWLRTNRNSNRIRAVGGVELGIESGECFGLVGESGCGKSTLARAIMQLVPMDRGNVLIDEQILANASLRRMQMVFQNAQSSMNPRMTVELIVSDPLRFENRCHKSERADRVTQALQLVGLEEAFRKRYPHELSGGQLQRVAIARAIVLDPDVLICDEPVSALDVTAQVEILDRLKEIQIDRSLTLLFITHDLDIAAAICDRLAVMHQGRIVETGPTAGVLHNPKHAYTQSLIAARLHAKCVVEP